MQGYCIREGLKVYIPEYILTLNPDSCLLFGCRTQTSCFITAVIHLPVKIHELENLLSQCNSPKPSQRVSGRIGRALPACAWDVVGIWNSAHSDIGDHREHDGHVNTAHLLGALRHRLGDHREKDESWLVIEAKPSELPHAHLSPVGSMCASQPQLPILLIAYKTSTLLQSCVLQQPEPAVRSPSETADMIILTRILRQYCCLRERWAVTEKMVRVDSTDLIGRAVFREKQVVVPDSPISPVPHRAVSRVSKVIAWSSTGRQLVNSYNKIKLLSSDQPILRKWNVATSIALDVLLGLLLLYTLHSYGYNHITFATHILDFADRIVGLLQTILIWLMGVPAGLKLNAPLNFALGRFFLYHIYLWKGYIVVLLKPNLPALVFCVGVVGLGGLSFQISMLSDVVVLLTVHIYCFYVYAARLYYVMVYALRSLFRLFRGKKWNVLRQRVDSCSYDMQQLFVGAILFTVLLFLFPTVAMYYAVFACLRVFVLACETAMCGVVRWLNICPAHAVALWLCQRPAVAGSVRYKILSSTQANNLWLSLELSTAPLSEILRHSQPAQTSETCDGGIGVAMTILSLLQGRLIGKTRKD